MHIYSLTDYKLKHCVILGQTEIKINSCIFDKKGKYLSFLVNLSEIFILNIAKDDNYLCQCDDFNDQNVHLVASKKSIISSFFSKIKVYIMLYISMLSMSNLKYGQDIN